MVFHICHAWNVLFWPKSLEGSDKDDIHIDLSTLAPRVRYIDTPLSVFWGEFDLRSSVIVRFFESPTVARSFIVLPKRAILGRFLPCRLITEFKPKQPRPSGDLAVRFTSVPESPRIERVLHFCIELSCAIHVHSLLLW